jgi:hypothetical protein
MRPTGDSLAEQAGSSPGAAAPTPTPDASTVMAALDAALASAGLAARWLAPDHRGLSVEVAGWPLDIGVAIQDGLLRAQAEVVGHNQVDPHELLHDHRKRPFARFSHADGGAVWVEGELPLLAATPELIDAMLGAVIEAAALARERAMAARR